MIIEMNPNLNLRYLTWWIFKLNIVYEKVLNIKFEPIGLG